VRFASSRFRNQYYLFAALAEADLDSHTLAGMQVKHRKCAEASAIDQLIGNKVQRPRLVRARDPAGVRRRDLARLNRR
jgi:hypothetical protein